MKEVYSRLFISRSLLRDSETLPATPVFHAVTVTFGLDT